jgi:hypothetical protein
MTWLLLDADMLLYQTVASCETEIEWMPDIITTHLPVKQAQSMFKDLVAQKEKQAKATQTLMKPTKETESTITAVNL